MIPKGIKTFFDFFHLKGGNIDPATFSAKTHFFEISPKDKRRPPDRLGTLGKRSVPLLPPASIIGYVHTLVKSTTSPFPICWVATNRAFSLLLGRSSDDYRDPGVSLLPKLFGVFQETIFSAPSKSVPRRRCSSKIFVACARTPCQPGKLAFKVPKNRPIGETLFT